MTKIPDNTVHIKNIDHFIQILCHWHEGKVKTLEHMLGIPQGVEVTFNDDGPQILQGELHRGFIIGLSLGLMELGTLPFAVEMEEEEEAKPATVNEPVQH